MNKKLKIILIIVAAVVVIAIVAAVVTVALVGIGIAGFVSWVWGGIRFTPDDAMEAVGIGASEQPRIATDNTYYYYETISDIYGEHPFGDWIIYITPVEQNDIGMWYAITNPRSEFVYIEGDTEAVADFFSFEEDGKYHNFLIPHFTWGDSPALPDAFPKDYNKLSIGDVELDMFRHSYFVTVIEVEEFEIDGVKFTIGN